MEIQVTVKLFAAYQEAFQAPELVLDLPSHSPVSEVLNQLVLRQPQLEQWRPITRFGINCQFVPPDTPLNNGDEVVLIPPVSGG